MLTVLNTLQWIANKYLTKQHDKQLEPLNSTKLNKSYVQAAEI